MTQQPRPKVLSASNALLAVFLLASSAAFSWGLYLLILELSGDDSQPFAHSYLPYQIALSALAVLFFGASFFLRKIVKTYLLIIVISVTVSVYAGEIYLQITTPENSLFEMFHGYDSKRVATNREMLLAERSKGREAWLHSGAVAWASHNPDTLQTEFMPFAGIARVTTIGCQEGPHELVYESDEHGFHNPVGIWGQREIDILAIGDSFTLGSCVPSSKNMVARIRRIHPKTINLGAGGNGSLLNLGALREYGPHLRPKIVLWFFYPNDLDSWESLIVTANRYLEEPDFEQNLIARQSEIDSRWKSLFRTVGIEKTAVPGALYGGSTLRSIVMLKTVRLHLGLEDLEGWLRDRAALTKRVIEQAKSLVTGWGGQLIFVYLPNASFYLAENTRVAHNAERWRQVVLENIADLRVDAVDLTQAFRRHSDPKSLFSNPRGRSHYSPDGYALVARTLLPVIGVKLAESGH